jgi:hypothetical protein
LLKQTALYSDTKDKKESKMKDDKSMQWTIEPTLQEFMDRKMVIARATFAKDSYFPACIAG